MPLELSVSPCGPAQFVSLQVLEPEHFAEFRMPWSPWHIPIAISKWLCIESAPQRAAFWVRLLGEHERGQGQGADLRDL
jgi:hypothetical protein